jgi:hypothetical protein
MTPETQVIGDCAVHRLETLLAKIEQETQEVVQQADIPDVAIHFSAFRELTRSLKARVAALEKHVDSLSYEIIPTLFTNANVKSINVVGLGTVTVNVRWSASMPDKEEGMNWLRATGNDGLIISTVSAQTLSSFAKDMALNGMPLPEEIFKVGTSQLVSIRKSGVSNDE